MSAFSHKPMMKTYIVIPKAGDVMQVRAEQMAMSPVYHSIRLFNGSRNQGETVALFHTESIVGVIEEASALDQLEYEQPFSSPPRFNIRPTIRP